MQTVTVNVEHDWQAEVLLGIAEHFNTEAPIPGQPTGAAVSLSVMYEGWQSGGYIISGTVSTKERIAMSCRIVRLAVGQAMGVVSEETGAGDDIAMSVIRKLMIDVLYEAKPSRSHATAQEAAKAARRQMNEGNQ